MIVDAHSHLPLALLAPGASVDIEPVLERKASEGIDHAIVSQVIVQLPPAAPPVLERVKRWNEIALGFQAEHRDRMSVMAGVDPLGGEPMLDEARDAVAAGAVGLSLTAPEGERLLGDAGAEEFWSLAEELAVPVFVHPPVGPLGSLDPRLWGFAARAVWVALNLGSIVLGGVLDRHPSVRIVAGAGGGGITALAGRLDAAYESYRTPARASDQADPAGLLEQAEWKTPRERPSAYFARMYVDTLLYSLPALRGALELFGPEHMLFGTDWPPVEIPAEVSLELIGQLDITDDQRDGVLGENAAGLFALSSVS